MWSTMMTLNPMLLEDPILRLDILMRSNSEYIKYMDHIMMSPNHMGIRVIMGDHMCFCRYVVKGFLNLKQTFGVQFMVICSSAFSS